MENFDKKRFGIFIKALHDEAGGKRPELVEGLFKTLDIKAGSLGELEGLLKNWVSGKNQSYKKLFKGIEISQSHYDSFIVLLKKKIGTRFEIVQSNLEELRGDFPYIDFETKCPDVFIESLLNQFKDIVGLPLSVNVIVNNTEDKSTDSNERSLSEKMCTKFVEIINAYGVMEIINRNPVIFYRVDSARLRLSHEMIMKQIVNPNREKCGDMALYVNIASFSTKLQLKAMSINKNLNIRFDNNDESDFINLEDDSDNEQIKSNLPEILTIPKVLYMMLEESDDYEDDDYEDEDCCDESDIDPQAILDLAEKWTAVWGDFRSEMNVMYNEIKKSCDIAPTSN